MKIDLTAADFRDWLIILVRNVNGAAERADLTRALRGDPYTTHKLHDGYRVAFDQLLAEKVLVVRLTNPMSKKKAREPGVFMARKLLSRDEKRFSDREWLAQQRVEIAARRRQRQVDVEQLYLRMSEAG